MCHYDANVNFLTRHGSAEWILKEHPRIMAVQDQIEESTIFRRTFTLNRVDPDAELKLRVFKHGKVILNGSSVWDGDSERHWKEEMRLPIAKWLKTGTNQIVVTVFNRSGPPALWLEMKNGTPTLVSDASWETSFGGVLWKAASLADSPMPNRLLEPSGLLSPFGSLSKKFPVLLLFITASLGMVFLCRVFAGLFSEGGGRSCATLLTALGVLFYLFLMVHNSGHLPDFYGFDADGHKDYITFVQEHNTLPLASDGWQMYQPPLYYLLCAELLSTFHLQISQHEGVVLVRFLGCAEAITLILLVLGSLRILFPRKIGAQVAGLFLAIALPALLYLSHYITNELMAALWMSAAILCCLNILKQSVFSGWSYLLLGLFLGLALLTKSSSVVALPVFAATLLIKLRQGSIFLAKEWVLALALPLFALVLTCGWYYWRVAAHFGSPFVGNWNPVSGNHWWQDEGYRTAAWYTGFGQIFRTPFLGSYGGFFNGLYASLFGDSLTGGQVNLLHRPPWNYELMGTGYFLAMIPLLLVVLGLAFQLSRFLRLPSPEWFLLLGLVFTYAFLLFYMTAVGPTWSSAKAFYAMQAIIPFCAFGAAGWEWVESRTGRFFTIVMASLMGAWVLTGALTYWINPSSTQALLMTGVGSQLAGDWGRARGEFDHAAKEYPDSAEARLFLGFADAALGNAVSAEKNYLAALELNPSDAQVHVLLARLMKKSGRSEESIALLRQAIVLEPQLAEPYNDLAGVLMRQAPSVENTKEALAMALQGCELTLYQNPVALLGLANAYARVGTPNLAAKTASEAYRKRGEVLLIQGNREQAVDEFRQALRLDPANSMALRNLDQAMARTNNRSPNPK